MNILDIVAQDFSYALRGIRRSRGFTLAVIATLALGVGANAALFSLADRLFLRQPRGVYRPEMLRRLYIRTNRTEGSIWEIHDRFEYPAFLSLRHSVGSRAQLAVYTAPDSMRVGDGDAAIVARGVYAESRFFPTVGARAVLGRVFNEQEDVMGNGARVAVISDAFWRRRFAGNTSVIGQVIAIAHDKYTIIGVMPAGFTGVDIDPTDVWIPLSAYPSMYGGASWYTKWRMDDPLRLLARLAPGTTDRWLSAVTTSTYRTNETAHVEHGADSTASLVAGPLLAALGPTTHPRTDVAITTRLIGVALIVLLTACANVANLLLARSITRRRELAVRLALGVSRLRLVVQLVVEGTTLALAAGVVAILVGAWGGAALQRVVLTGTESGEAGSLVDVRFVAVTLAVALTVGIASALLPALRASRLDLTHALKGGSRANTIEHARLRTMLVVAQAALSVVLLARSLDRATRIDLGYDAGRMFSATVQFIDPATRNVDSHPQRNTEITIGLRDAAQRVAKIAGVEAVAMASSPPLGGYAMIGLHLDDGANPPRLEDRDPTWFAVTPSYFAATGLRLVRGRLLNDNDRSGSELAVVVNETTARTYWPGRDAIGQCVFIRTTEPHERCSRVVGIVRDSHFDGLIETSRVALFSPVSQQISPFGKNPQYLIVRASPRAIGRVALETRRILRATFPSAEPPIVESTSAIVDNQLRPWKLGASIFAAFGVLSLLVAATGIYSVIAYSVTLRSHEIGVRVALGARRREVVSLILSQGMRMTVVGLMLGAVLTVALGRFVASMLYATSTHDPVAIGASIGSLIVVTVLACALPAWRAARTDPAIALRAD